ncbi:hypothetical protein BVRB_034020, partial [Beta vulgaris subsp. vulgaris]
LALLLATKVRGKIDTIGIRKELQIVTATFVIMQIFLVSLHPVEDSIIWNHDQDVDALEEQYGVEMVFSFWYEHTIKSIHIFLLIILVAVRPVLGILMHKDRFSSSRTVQQRLQEVSS